MVLFYITVALSLILGIIYHEYGHMITSKHYKIKVNRFSVGFGPILWKKKGKDDVEYCLSALPFGGYCEIDEKELDSKPYYQYVLVLIAGVVRNLILGLVLFILGACLLFIANGKAPNLLFAIQGAFDALWNVMSNFFNVLIDFFNIKLVASAGGMGTQMSTIGNGLSSFQSTTSIGSNILSQLGLGFIVGGSFNFALLLCNLLPIPAIDGGQILIKTIRVTLLKIFKKEIFTKKLADMINVAGFCFLLFYQGIILLCDIPAVKELILRL